MSTTKSRKYPFFYEGLYWRDRKAYVAWVKAKRNATLDNLKMSKASFKNAA